MPSLSESDRGALLELAREAVIEAVSNGHIPAEIPGGGVFAQRHGVFVTLHVKRRLRGCIGVIDAVDSLGDSVVRCAATAALHDPRFRAIRLEELPDLSIEISLLSETTPIRPESIEIGKHGLLIIRGPQRGLLLPQVAVEHHLNVEQFLAETCRKAQLNPEAWRDADAELMGFTCEVFTEQEDS
jgi:AmmeMemoRadiSam system protein A